MTIRLNLIAAALLGAATALAATAADAEVSDDAPKEAWRPLAEGGCDGAVPRKQP